jgi:predicted nucleotidyltransferase
LASGDQAALAEFISYVQRAFPNRILNLALFGSKARGDADAESDIDLLVLVNTDDTELRSALWRVASDISLQYNVVLSLRVLPQSRWSEMQRMHLPLYRAIMADGIPLPLTTPLAMSTSH